MQGNLILKSSLTIADIIGHAIIWVLLVPLTLGFALFVYPYYLYRFVISKTTAYSADGREIGRLACTIDLATIIGNIVIWAIISVVTLGVGYIFFMYKIIAHCMSHTRVISHASA
ncbi:DUF6693 family protein [Paraburkholderia sp. PREW-6R]|uniref:DUF6693 family protein n=1 Tax=Paraburkholderia sp. PREW-6R TaxID=3141544 RepID=UPI0031F58905